MKRWLWLVMVFYLAFMGCATGVPSGPGKYGGESYPPSWDDPFYDLKHSQN